MILMLDDSTVARNAAGTGPRPFDDWRGVDPRTARTLRRLGFSAALAAPRFSGVAPVPPARRGDATAMEWRPL